MQMMQMMQGMEKREQDEKTGSREPALIRPAKAPGLEASGIEKGEESANQEMLMKVPLEISVEIGRTKKLVKDILEFTQGISCGPGQNGRRTGRPVCKWTVCCQRRYCSSRG